MGIIVNNLDDLLLPRFGIRHYSFVIMVSREEAIKNEIFIIVFRVKVWYLLHEICSLT